MSDQTVEQIRAEVAYGCATVERVDALIASVRADTLRQVEQEARRLGEEWGVDLSGDPRFVGMADGVSVLADWCQQQREGR